jgi:hypothetical protein
MPTALWTGVCCVGFHKDLADGWETQPAEHTPQRLSRLQYRRRVLQAADRCGNRWTVLGTGTDQHLVEPSRPDLADDQACHPRAPAHVSRHQRDAMAVRHHILDDLEILETKPDSGPNTRRHSE